MKTGKNARAEFSKNQEIKSSQFQGILGSKLTRGYTRQRQLDSKAHIIFSDTKSIYARSGFEPTIKSKAKALLDKNKGKSY